MQAEDVKELMAYEGEVWMRFYGGFVYFLPEDFVMNKRVKRPPDNPINALISLKYTVIYEDNCCNLSDTSGSKDQFSSRTIRRKIFFKPGSQ